jgi:hypothetical protein
MFRQILKGLEESTADIVYLCEHDVLYHPSHFDFTPPDRTRVYYNQNTWQTRVSDGFAVKYTCKTVSQLCAYRDILIKHYKERIRRIETEGRYDSKMGYEPGAARRAERVDDLISETFESSGPNAELRHGNNLTKSKWSPAEFRHDRYCRNWQNGTCPEWAVGILKGITNKVE